MNEYLKLKEDIEQADYVVIGIGDKFGYDWKRLEEDVRFNELFEQISNDDSLKWCIPFLQKVSMDTHKDEILANAYSSLAKLINNKDAYVITTTIDDYVYESGIDLSRIVTPCGGFKRLQCKNACLDETINLPLALLQYVQKLYNNMMSLDEIRDKYPECPHCGADLVFNQIGADKYVETAYLPKWGQYKDWLEKTMNRRLVLIELGVGMGFMPVIRAPFEKLVNYNLKSTLYRVHPTLYMGIPNVDDRCISIKAEPKDWIIGIN